MGPALSGSPSWNHFMSVVEEKLREYGAVDITRNAWTYDRWSTSQWPDDSKWTLTVGGRKIRAASYGANSGTTPEAGITAELALYDPAAPAPSFTGRIVVVQTTPETE